VPVQNRRGPASHFIGPESNANGFSWAIQPVKAGRIGSKLGKVSELTIFAPLVPGGAKRIRGFIDLLHGDFSTSDKIGTLHDMRFVFLDDDKKMIFATTYDGDWDAYIDDFATKMPDSLDVIFSACEGLALQSGMLRR